jgi:hypothetical protein
MLVPSKRPTCKLNNMMYLFHSPTCLNGWMTLKPPYLTAARQICPPKSLANKAFCCILGPRRDFAGDICGKEGRLLSSVSYMWIFIHCYVIFTRIESSLRDSRNQAWIQVYEKNSRMTQQKRLTLTTLVLREGDTECLRVISDILEEEKGGGFSDHIYWDNLADALGEAAFDCTNLSNPNSCTIMWILRLNLEDLRSYWCVVVLVN